MLNVYEQVTNNKTKSILVVAIFVAFISFSAYLITITFDLDNSFITTAIGFSFIGSFISYFYGDKIILSLNRARPAKRKEFFANSLLQKSTLLTLPPLTLLPPAEIPKMLLSVPPPACLTN